MSAFKGSLWDSHSAKLTYTVSIPGNGSLNGDLREEGLGATVKAARITGRSMSTEKKVSRSWKDFSLTYSVVQCGLMDVSYQKASEKVTWRTSDICPQM